MIRKVHLRIARLHRSRILLLAGSDPRFDRVLPPQIQHLRDDEHLRHAQRAQRERIAQHVRTRAVDLPDHDARRVAQRLLQADGRRAAVVRRHVDVQPGDVQPGTGVGGHGAEEGREVLDGVGRDGQEEDVAHHGEDVRCEKEDCEFRGPVGEERDGREAKCAPDVDRHRQCVAPQRVVAHAVQDRGQERAESVEEDVLAELDEAAAGITLVCI